MGLFFISPTVKISDGETGINTGLVFDLLLFIGNFFAKGIGKGTRIYAAAE